MLTYSAGHGYRALSDVQIDINGSPAPPHGVVKKDPCQGALAYVHRPDDHCDWTANWAVLLYSTLRLSPRPFQTCVRVQIYYLTINIQKYSKNINNIRKNINDNLVQSSVIGPRRNLRP